MAEKKVKVVLVGPHKCGKSWVGMIIAQALRAYGAEVEFLGEEAEEQRARVISSMKPRWQEKGTLDERAKDFLTGAEVEIEAVVPRRGDGKT